jgi:integrase
MQIRVARSYERETTKGGHGDLLPIPDVMRPYLEVALKSPGLLLFGDARGRMRKPHSKPDVVLRRALKHANICIGFRLICRRCTTDGKLTAQIVADRPSPAPKCTVCATRKLWVTPLPRHVRFHDLRHSTATILLRDGVDAHRVQKLMRHASFDTTSRTYAHLIVEDLRAGQAVAFGGRDELELDLDNADRAQLVAEVVRLRRLLAAGTSPAPTPDPTEAPRQESIAT